jgi:hypothetical protein
MIEALLLASAERIARFVDDEEALLVISRTV